MHGQPNQQRQFPAPLPQDPERRHEIWRRRDQPHYPVSRLNVRKLGCTPAASSDHSQRNNQQGLLFFTQKLAGVFPMPKCQAGSYGLHYQCELQAATTGNCSAALKIYRRICRAQGTDNSKAAIIKMVAGAGFEPATFGL